MSIGGGTGLILPLKIKIKDQQQKHKNFQATPDSYLGKNRTEGGPVN